MSHKKQLTARNIYPHTSRALVFMRGVISFSLSNEVALEGLRRFEGKTGFKLQRNNYLRQLRDGATFFDICRILQREKLSSEAQIYLTKELKQLYDQTLNFALAKSYGIFAQLTPETLRQHFMHDVQIAFQDLEPVPALKRMWLQAKELEVKQLCGPARRNIVDLIQF
ncbi:MAG: hypothetical protein ABII22_00975 [Candidatus Micrarchaeota archaeon]